MKNKVIVTGANGFIGSALVSYLLKKDFTVIAICHSKNIPIKSKKLTQFRADFLDDMDIIKLKNVFDNVSICVHLAGYIPKSGSASDMSTRANDNLQMNKKFTKLLHKKIFLIFISTIDVYQALLDRGNPNNLYGLAKLESEQIFQKYYGRAKNNLCVLRLVHTYGPGDMSNKIIPKLIYSKLINKTIDLFESDARRDFIYINDVCKIILNVILEQISGTHNVSSGKMIAIKDLYKIIVENARIKLHQSKYSNNKSDLTLKKNSTSLDNGLKKTKQRMIMEEIKKGGCTVFTDLDGVILDSEKKYFDLHKKIVYKITEKKTTLTGKQFWELKRANTSIKKILFSDDISPKMVSTYQKEFENLIESRNYLSKDSLIKSNINVIKKIKLKNKVYLVTLRKNKLNLIKQLSELNIYDIFDKILVSNQLDGSWLSKSNLINKNKSDDKINVLIGDTEIDIKVAENCKLFSIIVSSGIRSYCFLSQLRPDVIFQNLNYFWGK